MNPREFHLIQSRRNFFRSCAGGIGTIALANLLNSEGYGAEPADPLVAIAVANDACSSVNAVAVAIRRIGIREDRRIARL